MGKVRIGTSGFSYDGWFGNFYPEDLRKDELLSYYAKHFDTCEIHNTFYKMPSPKLVAGWAGQVPPAFSFALKASLKITHLRRLKDAAPFVTEFALAHKELGKRTGPVLFQLPPYLKKDVPLLEQLFKTVGRKMRLAMEFGNDTWLDEEVFDVLRERDAALVCVDDEKRPLAFRPVGTLAYVRLRRPRYSRADLAAWAERVSDPQFSDGAYVFFKHEDEGKAPDLAQRFKDAVTMLER